MLETTVASVLLAALVMALVLARVAGRGIRAGSTTTPNAANRHLRRAVVEHSRVGIALLDRSLHILHANSAFERILGRDLGAMRGRRLAEFAAADDAAGIASLAQDVGPTVRDGAAVEARFTRGDGSEVWCTLALSQAGRRSRGECVAVVQDVSERKALEAKVLYQATHDPLTELPNRALFREHVDHALIRHAHEANAIAVLFLDVDGFKVTNDAQGHRAGDRLLRVVAERLVSVCNGYDVARLGGDEFAVLLEHSDALSAAEGVAQRIVSILRKPIGTVGDGSVALSASFGIAVASGSEDTEALLRNADVAMYEAKQCTPGRWAVFDPSMHTALSERATLEADLRRALQRCQLLQRPRLSTTGVYAAFDAREETQNELRVQYQPVVDLRSGHIVAVEALARWSHPTRGPIEPRQFIPVAEESGLISTLGRCVLREACRQAAQWTEARGGAPLRVSVNLSGSEFEDDGIAAEVSSVLQETALAPEHLVLEITETVVMQNVESTLARLHELKKLGVGLAIDDFGTGYSSLSYLQRFPVDVVKIDRVFVDGLRRGNEGVALIRTILTLARMLNLRAIAEGVEEVGQRRYLHEMGCNAAQGFLFGRAMPPAELGAILAGPRGRIPSDRRADARSSRRRELT